MQQICPELTNDQANNIPRIDIPLLQIVSKRLRRHVKDPMVFVILRAQRARLFACQLHSDLPRETTDAVARNLLLIHERTRGRYEDDCCELPVDCVSLLES
jgi:hypothetical protein